jgi:hypothetical protein
MLWTIGGAIVGSVLLNIIGSVFVREGAGKKDQRDREIYRFGESVGQSFLVIGSVAALLISMAELPY